MFFLFASVSFFGYDLPELINTFYANPEMEWRFFTSGILRADVYDAKSHDIVRTNLDYLIEMKSRVPFLHIESLEYPLYCGETVLALPVHGHNILFLLYVDKYGNVKSDSFKGRAVYDFSIEEDTLSVSSEYRDDSDSFPSGNLLSTDDFKPWVEGVPGDGIGEEIVVQDKDAASPRYTGFIISNGFVSYEKPHLFLYNNRVKKILISDLDGSRVFEVDLPDSPVPQFIQFKEKYTGIKLRILEVYKGEKWDDTCINFILPEKSTFGW